MSKPSPDSESEIAQLFLEHMCLYTLRLVKLTENYLPNGAASGFILEENNSYFLLSAGHSFWKEGAWGIETDVITDEGVLIIPVPPLQLLSKLTLKSGANVTEALQAKLAQLESIDVKDIAKPYLDSTGFSIHPLDVAWAKLDFSELDELALKHPALANERLSLPIYRGPINTKPSRRSLYGFAALKPIELEHHGDLIILDRDIRYEYGMQYIGTDRKYDLYKFLLARSHQGDEYYHGVSGAPIADLTGKIVAIVVSGSEDDNLIYGLPLRRVSRFLGL
jgi:hypothetical protein